MRKNLEQSISVPQKSHRLKAAVQSFAIRAQSQYYIFIFVISVGLSLALILRKGGRF